MNDVRYASDRRPSPRRAGASSPPDGSASSMTGWRARRPGPIGTAPLDLVREPVPRPGADELLVRVHGCGVCRTDLHIAEGDLPAHRAGVVPGHEVVGEVVSMGEAALGGGFAPGDRVGIAWLRRTCGECKYCARGSENLCPRSVYTGWDTDGGYAEFATVPVDYALRLPAGYGAVETAPLLCAGIIGYRALQRAMLPASGRLGIYGFGGSGHIAAQIALARGAEVHVMTRDPQARELAIELGAASAQAPSRPPPAPLDSAILFAPAGELVPTALAALDRGGVLAVAGIHLSAIPALDYQRQLFQEREIRSVTANTRADAVEFLELAEQHHIRVDTTTYPLDAADRALDDLAHSRFTGAAVLVP